MKDLFELRILNHHWIKGEGDDPHDLCSHGHVFVRIGEETVCDANTLDVTTSAAALHLIRTLSQNYLPGDFEAQLLPCCGFFICYGEDGLTADIHGCPSGIDWKVTHQGDSVSL